MATTVRAAFLGVLDHLSEDEQAEVLAYARQVPADAPADGTGERARREEQWDDEGGHQ